MTVQVRGRGDGNTWGLQLLMERRVEQFDGGGAQIAMMMMMNARLGDKIKYYNFFDQIP